GNLLHKQNRQGCVQQALTFSLRVSQLANGTGTFRRHLAKKNSRTLDHVLAAKSVYLSLAHVAW
ncbi:hypothetical protein, partial [Achromobacter xylosoxidans]|uniref:hypothetical protein n=1 Tax=Alcaligenes xylosoxydans xylosoxydans TaxID=85698 RepID=UPI001EEB6FD0